MIAFPLYVNEMMVTGQETMVSVPSMTISCHEMTISCHEMTILILFPASRLCFGWLQTNGTDLPAHTIDSNTHITRMLSYNKAIVYIQIKHGVFDCKVHKQKRLVKVGSFRMVTKKPPLILHGQGAAYYLMQFRIIRRRALLREPQLQEPLSQGPL